ncbi:MAG: hypothetical protein IKQ46_12680 [Bacteroidales bacterium]|nr:hypothetical protein [Bacteroidales bacterium]
MKKILIFNIITISLLLITNLTINNLPSGKNCILLSDSGSITGVGKVDLFNKKQGNWIFLYPNSGRICFSGEFIDDKRNGEWFKFYDEPNPNLEYYYNFLGDSIDGVVKNFGGSGFYTFYYKNGEKKFNRQKPSGDYIDADTPFEMDLLAALYNEEYVNLIDDEWIHKKTRTSKDLQLISSDCFWDNNLVDFVIEEDSSDDSKPYLNNTNIYINNWIEVIKIINYSTFVILLIVNILGLKKW